MARIIDTLITELQLRGDQYMRVAAQVTGATRNMAGAMMNVGGIITGVGTAALGGAAAALIGVGVAAFNAYGDLEELKSGLKAVAGSAEAAEGQLVRLRNVAKLPGLDLNGAIQMSISLQASEMAALDAERALKGFGNALATVGRSGELSGVIYGVTQLYGSTEVLAEDLNIIKERIPQLPSILKALYGSARPDDIRALGIAPKQLVHDLIRELLKLPQVSGGAKNSIVNLGAAVQGALAAAGKPIATFVIPILERAATLFEWLDSSGVAERIATQFTKLFDSGALVDGLTRGFFVVKEIVQRVPGWLSTAFAKVTEGFQTMQDNFLTVVRHIRAGSIVIGASLVGMFVGGAVIKGLGAIATAWKAISAATKTATVMQIVYEAVVTKGLSITAGLLAATAAFAVAVVALEQFIPQVPQGEKFEVPSMLDIWESADAASIEFNRFLRGEDEQEKRQKKLDAAKAQGASGGIGGPANAIANALKENSEATERNTAIQERIADLNRQLQGGGTFAEAATSELAMARYTGRTGIGDPDLDRAMQHLARYADKAAGRHMRSASRRLGDAGAF